MTTIEERIREILEKSFTVPGNSDDRREYAEKELAALVESERTEGYNKGLKAPHGDLGVAYKGGFEAGFEAGAKALAEKFKEKCWPSLLGGQIEMASALADVLGKDGK